MCGGISHPATAWYDRAVFYFLTEPADRARNREILERALAAGG